MRSIVAAADTEFASHPRPGPRVARIWVMSPTGHDGNRSFHVGSMRQADVPIRYELFRGAIEPESAVNCTETISESLNRR